MPHIPISESLFAKIKGLAEPFVDTPESVIGKCVDFYISKNSGEFQPAAAVAEVGPIKFPADAAPDLTFTRPIAITLDGKKFEKSSLYWNALLFELVKRASAKLSPDKLRQAILVNFVENEGSQDTGYRFIPEAKLSVQGQASNAAWKAILHLVRASGMNLDVVFLWENKDKAAHPGKTGQMTFVAS